MLTRRLLGFLLGAATLPLAPSAALAGTFQVAWNGDGTITSERDL